MTAGQYSALLAQYYQTMAQYYPQQYGGGYNQQAYASYPQQQTQRFAPQPKPGFGQTDRGGFGQSGPSGYSPQGYTPQSQQVGFAQQSGYGRQSPYSYNQQSPYGYGQQSPYGYEQQAPPARQQAPPVRQQAPPARQQAPPARQQPPPSAPAREIPTFPGSRPDEIPTFPGSNPNEIPTFPGSNPNEIPTFPGSVADGIPTFPGSTAIARSAGRELPTYPGSSELPTYPGPGNSVPRRLPNGGSEPESVALSNVGTNNPGGPTIVGVDEQYFRSTGQKVPAFIGGNMVTGGREAPARSAPAPSSGGRFQPRIVGMETGYQIPDSLRQYQREEGFQNDEPSRDRISEPIITGFDMPPQVPVVAHFAKRGDTEESVSATSNGCDGMTKLVTSLPGSVRAPTSGNRYYPNLKCKWLIRNPSGKGISFNWDYFDVESSNGCENDWVEMYQGSAVIAKNLLGRWCGAIGSARLPRFFEISSGEVMVLFNTNGDFNLRGFDLRFRTV